MIKKLNVDDIARLLRKNDHAIKKSLFKDTGQWVQFLMQNINNDRLFIVGKFDNETLLEYCVCVFSKGDTFLFYVSDDKKYEKDFKQAALKWAIRFNKKKILYGNSNNSLKVWAGGK